jgi:hypothetical protein
VYKWQENFASRTTSTLDIFCPAKIHLHQFGCFEKVVANTDNPTLHDPTQKPPRPKMTVHRLVDPSETVITISAAPIDAAKNENVA